MGIAVGKDGSVYWAQYRTDTIERAGADGGHGATIAKVDGPLGLAIDQARGVLFYTADRHYPRSIGSLKPGAKPFGLVCGSRVNRPFAIAVVGAADRAALRRVGRTAKQAHRRRNAR